jgi:hypothetical protein
MPKLTDTSEIPARECCIAKRISLATLGRVPALFFLSAVHPESAAWFESSFCS